jgi:acetyl-CoA synthetase/medium-chain acyl-CoA synthetase
MGEANAHFNFTRDVFEYWAQKRPGGLALWWIDESGGERGFSFHELAETSRRCADAFARAGLRPGDRVLVILPRVPQWWTAMLGLIRLGAVPIPGTPLLTARDIEYRIGAADVRGLITDAQGAEKAAGFPGIRFVVGDAPGGWIAFDDAIKKADPAFDPPATLASDPGIIYFTSGTTGHPKMVLHTQASYGLGHHATGELWLNLRPGDVLWNLSDTGWAKAAWSSFFAPWNMGACIFALDARGKFDSRIVLDTLANFQITTWCAPPTALRMMVREDLTKWKFPSLRHCVSAGEPLNPEVIATWRDATGLTIYEGYGQTESVVLVHNCRSHGRELRLGSMGHPTPGYDVQVLDADLNPLPPEREGEVAVRVKPHRPLGLFKEYWKNDSENAARFRGDWYLTGDVARRDADGYFWFVGRSDDVIKSAGYRIGPFEVESALVEHPAVLEAAVVGMPDETRGQIVKAYVVLRKNATACDELKLELQEHCKRVTAPYKYPREVEFVAELPKTISGKIRRVELRGASPSPPYSGERAG